MNSAAKKTFIQPYTDKPVFSHSFIASLDNIARRILDISLSLIGIILLSPAFLLIAFLIKRDSPGPVFYRGWRAGRKGRDFQILKFRTMYEREESYQGAKVTAKDDPRITPTGRWLRNTKINELPQLWNVLKGEMSLVGPRPEDPNIAARWPEDVRREVLSVRPGVTSPASVLYRHEENLLQSNSVMDKYLWDILPSKLRLDQLYVRYRTVLTDLDVVFWTAVVLLPSLKEVTVPEHLLYWGPLSVFINRYLNWFLIDTLVSFGAIGTAGIIWRLGAPLDLGIGLASTIALAIALLFSLINSLMGLNRIEWSRARSGDAMDLALSSGMVTLVLFMLNLLWPVEPLLPPSMVVVAGAFTFTGCAAARYRSRLFTGLGLRWLGLRGGSMGSIGERVLIVGAGETAHFGAWLMRNGSLAQAFSILGMVDDNPRMVGTQVDGCKVIGSTQDIPSLLEKHDVGLILFAISNISQSEQERILSLCQNSASRVVLIPDILDSLRAHFPAEEMDRDKIFNKVIHNTTVDKLTGIYNKQHFLNLVEAELPRARRYGHDLSAIVIVVDYIRPDETTYVPAVGARVMREVAERCQNNIRQIDLLGRYNGNKFAILLPETNEAAAYFVAERIRRYIINKPVESDFGSLALTVRLGVASYCGDDSGGASLLERALAAMDVKEIAL